MSLPKSREELLGLSAGALKALLVQLGTDSLDCVEKADFLAKAAKHLKIDLSGASSASAAGQSAAVEAVAAADATEVSEDEPCGSLRSEPALSSEDEKSSPSPSRGSRRRPGRSRSSSSSTADEVEAERRRRLKRPPDYGTDYLKLGHDGAAAFTEKMRDKIERASEAEVVMNSVAVQLEIRGSEVQRRRARKYAELVTRQRLGPMFSEADVNDGDLTIVIVPPEVVGYVQGHGGQVLRNIEDEWNTLMLFVDNDLSRAQRLAVFGSVRARRGAELKVMSAIETKMPGYLKHVLADLVKRDLGKDKTGTWGTDYMYFQDEGEISYALGKQGGTRRKLERSSGAVVQYVGMCVMCSGTAAERKRSREYMKWLFQQLEGPVYVAGWEGRDDCTVVEIPADCIGYITGNRRATLGSLEEEWGTLMFFMSDATSGGPSIGGERGRGGGRERPQRGSGGGSEKLMIFGPKRARRGSELKVSVKRSQSSPCGV
eukprot:TRINITY_DN32028_c0_g1_i4.p1 TRINITY_DN32028_c0_g1~~TRINITY_DN32028_c0_g1_i4.p1  ORF type:complete len:487 (-),score=115.78 TRINITY_DN32028_c0_g1_i4:43-1503(-)